MALYATNRFPGDGSTTSYEFNFVGKYIARSHVKVYQEDNATKVRTYVSINDGNFLNDTTLRNLPVTPVGSTIVICRETPKPPLVDFVNGSRFTEYNMDLVARQGLFVALEAFDNGGADARQQLLDAVAVGTALTTAATTAETNSAASAAAAAASAATAANYAGTGNHCQLRWDSPGYVRLVRAGGATMMIHGVPVVIPAAGFAIYAGAGAGAGSTVRGVFVFQNSGAIAGGYLDTAQPVWNATYGQWVHPASSSDVFVGACRPDMMVSEVSSHRYLRSVYNPTPLVADRGLATTSSRVWNNTKSNVVSVEMLLMPGDTMDISAQASVVSAPADRVGDANIELAGSILRASRMTHDIAYSWRTHSVRWLGRRGFADPVQLGTFDLTYHGLSSGGGWYDIAGGADFGTGIWAKVISHAIG